MKTTSTRPDVFGMARERFTIADLWETLGLQGNPKASCKSPFREDGSPSFSIHSDGKAWTDHGAGEGGDVVDFAMRALDLDHAGARQWFSDRMGITSGSPVRSTRKPAKASEAPKAIRWPSEIIEGTTATWQAFANRRGYSFPGVWAMAKGGILRFTIIDGVKCFVVTDAAGRAAEIPG